MKTTLMILIDNLKRLTVVRTNTFISSFIQTWTFTFNDNAFVILVRGFSQILFGTNRQKYQLVGIFVWDTL